MTTINPYKIIVAGGGTGGHIFPAVSIANAFKQMYSDANILFVGAKGKMEMEKVPKEGYEIIGLDIAGFNRSSLLKNISLPFKIVKSFLQARKILKEFKPDAVVGVGGFASFSVLYMAQRLGIPTLIQEQNSFAGKSNKILGKKANVICVAYDNMEKFFPKEKIVKTGNPIRQTIAHNQITKEQGIQFFNLNHHQKVVFAFGGSLGARSINQAIFNHIKQFAENNIQLIWQTGTAFFEKAKDACKQFESTIKVYDFLREMDYAYSTADLIISRAGASSISELSIVAKPVVFVPFPYASEDHQTHNAMALVKHNAAAILKDSETDSQLFNTILHFINDENGCSEMTQNIKAFAMLDADKLIAQHLKRIINK
ncbi:MAG TPA: undecaprenyldiphospho-muramoylpentapeptide beta-N-acetylglucosaminyltransferase [Chitinophagaceae bacterium]|nr:MAG: UDP-N-acetylglucosamine-N-acetylmuramyl- (pentapeptide) pyrophosphoryl-undecaprenol N- acetylglucosamine transferase [Bacteroidetes bacterium OLB11]HMN31751.1 undecaprenyldiphospho-muramoylpentapeptide beta-N-acetylglucosaminyltransferase [Chitinophagaceae bacterium]